MGAALPWITDDGRLSPGVRAVLHAVSGVPDDLLARTRVRPARANLLHAPWYRYHRGGAMTIGTTIWFTRLYFDPHGHGNDRPSSAWAWLALLAHEVGHLPQAQRFGEGRWGRIRYVSAFVGQYGARALTGRFPVHDGSPLEIEADLGRWVLQQLVPHPPGHPLVEAVRTNDTGTISAWCAQHADRIRALQEQYRHGPTGSP